MKVATVALVIRGREPSLVDVISDDQEIHLLESSIRAGEPDPLKIIQDFRARQVAEEDEFGQYVEDLLSRPFLHTEVQEHGLQWLKSKIRLEQFQQNETEAAKVIAEYAMKIFIENPEKTDFFLAGANSMVRIRVFSQPRSEPNSNAA